MSPLRWTAKSVRRLPEELTAAGHPVSASKVGQLLGAMDYSLQAPAKENEGAQHPDRDAQFDHINQQANPHLDAGEPVISVDTKEEGGRREPGQQWPGVSAQRHTGARGGA
jgi:hypothetical protein